MAVMKDSMPEKYMGEKRVWECIERNLPEDVVCYYNREVKGREFDFCLLIKNIGFLIIEVKGWNPNHIMSIDSPDKIVLSNGSVSSSPKKQARSYKFCLHNILSENYNVNPLILDMVCYPFISEEEYERVGLNIVSESDFTLFREDIESAQNFGRKIINAYNNFSHIKFDKMADNVYDICRHYFEPTYIVRPPMQTFIPYSRLSVYSGTIPLSDIDEILKSYSEGTKQIVFTNQLSDINLLALHLSDFFKRNCILTDKNDLKICKKSEYAGSGIDISNNKITLFNFEVYYIQNCEIKFSFVSFNGILEDEQKKSILEFDKFSDFNFNQFKVEHAEVGKDIQVRAGAGTGKTYSMVSRIAFLCSMASDSGIFNPAEEIAMLTFTTDAAANMKSRLKQLYLNYFILTKNVKYLEMVSNVEKMRISTIHSFAKEIIKNTSISFGVGTNFTTVSGIYEKQKIFDRLFTEYLSAYNEEKPIFFDDMPPMKIEYLRKCLLNFSAKLYNKGCDIKNISIEYFGKPIEEMPFINDMIEKVVIAAEREYTKYLLENNSVHLSEYMIYFSKAISDEAFNKNLFEFKYIFIDEFQDTDDAQIAAFLNMQKKLYFKFFVVGDLKQSIYRFRGATMDSFEKMGCERGEWLSFSLNKNYRSDSRLLSRFEGLFEYMGRSNLIPYNSSVDRIIGVKTNLSYSDENLINVHKYTSSELKEKDAFYDKLFEVINEQKGIISKRMEQQVLKPAERTIAILVRSNYQIQNIIKEAKKRNTSIDSNIGSDLYKLQSTIDLCKLTAALSNPYNSTYLYDLINSNYINTDFKLSYIVSLSSEEKTQVLIDCLDDFYIKTLNKTWGELISDVQNEPILKSLRIIYEKTCPWKQYSSDEDMQEFYRINYELLFEELSNANNKSYLTLDSVNQSLHIVISTNVEGKARDINVVNEGVRVVCLTVHKSKGLEYGTVILPFTSSKYDSFHKNSVDVTYLNEKVGYCFSGEGDRFYNEYYAVETETEESMMEESRVLYVALTRAINNFIWFENVDSNNYSWGTILREL